MCSNLFGFLFQSPVWFKDFTAKTGRNPYSVSCRCGLQQPTPPRARSVLLAWALWFTSWPWSGLFQHHLVLLTPGLRGRNMCMCVCGRWWLRCMPTSYKGYTPRNRQAQHFIISHSNHFLTTTKIGLITLIYLIYTYTYICTYIYILEGGIGELEWSPKSSKAFCLKTCLKSIRQRDLTF